MLLDPARPSPTTRPAWARSRSSEPGLSHPPGAREEGGDRPRAEAIMKKLMMNSPINDIRRKAQQLGFQKEAAEFLKLRDDDDADKPSEWSQLGKLRPVKTEKRYALTDGYLASPKRKPAKKTLSLTGGGRRY